MKEHMSVAMNVALKYAQTVRPLLPTWRVSRSLYVFCQVLQIQPSDKAIMYDIAMIEQKMAVDVWIGTR